MDYADWVLENTSMPTWILLTMPLQVAGCMFLGFYGWQTQDNYTTIISEKALAMIVVGPTWFCINLFTVAIWMIILPLEKFFFPDKFKVIASIAIAIAVAIFTFSAYEEYRFDRALIDNGWVHCRHETFAGPSRMNVAYAQHREWCPRTRSEMR